MRKQRKAKSTRDVKSRMIKKEEMPATIPVAANGDNDLASKSSSHIVITPFINFRKSFKKFKQKKRPLQEDSVNKNGVNDADVVDNIPNKIQNPEKDIENTMNILKRINAYRTSKKKKKRMSPPLNNSSLNIVKWSSCESISDCKVGKHNSLRRSRASLIVPTTSSDYYYQKTNNLSRKIPQYNSMNCINDPKPPSSSSDIRYASQILPNKSSPPTEVPDELTLEVETPTLNLAEEISEELSQMFSNASTLATMSGNILDGNSRNKRAIIKKAKSHSLSLPNISEHNIEETCIDIDIDDVVVNIEEGNSPSSTDGNQENNSSSIIRRNTNKSNSFKRHSTYASDKLLLTPSVSLNNDRSSIYFSNDSLFCSTMSINRPPVPCCPKPRQRRDMLLKSASTEALSARKSRKSDEGNSNELARKRTLSSPDCTAAQKKKDARKSVNFDIEENIENELKVLEGIECKRPKPNIRGCTSTTDIPNLIFNERLWKRALSCQQLPYAIAEAVWDHASLDPEELSFSSGDVLHVLFVEDANWWWGTKGDKEGWFPASYVRQCVIQEIGSSLTCKGDFQKKINCGGGADPASLSSPLAPSVDEKLKAVRAKCVEELLTTEVDYVQLLKNIIEGYLEPIRNEEQLFDKEDAEVLFSNIEELYAFHQQFVKELKEVIDVEHMETSSVGCVFLKHESNFEIYSKYCNNQPKSSARLSSLTKDKKYKCFFERCRLQQNMIRLSLDGFLLSPVQRICKYPLQLKELLKHTSSEHEDYDALANARTCMQNVASLINERKRRLENVHNLACWQYSVVNWRDEDLALKSNELIHTSVLGKIVSNRIAERIVYIFDHQLIYFRKYSAKRHHLSYCGRIDLDSANLIDVEDNVIALDGVNITHAWKVWDGVKMRWHLFMAKTAKEKEEWLDVFRKERKLVQEENEKGLNVSLEVREAAIETAHAKHLSELKRRRIRRKSVSSYVGTEVGGTSPIHPKFNDIAAICSAETVPKRRQRARRKSSFRWSLGSMFEKYL